MASADVKTVEGFLTSLVSGDLESAVSLLTDDVELVEAGGIPHSGTYRGHAGVYELIGKIGDLFGGFALGDSSFHDAGEFVVGRMTATFFSKADPDKSASMPVAEHYWLRDGKIAYVDVYYKYPERLEAL